MYIKIKDGKYFICDTYRERRTTQTPIESDDNYKVILQDLHSLELFNNCINGDRIYFLGGRTGNKTLHGKFTGLIDYNSGCDFTSGRYFNARFEIKREDNNETYMVRLSEVTEGKVGLTKKSLWFKDAGYIIKGEILTRCEPYIVTDLHDHRERNRTFYHKAVTYGSAYCKRYHFYRDGISDNVTLYGFRNKCLGTIHFEYHTHQDFLLIKNCPNNEELKELNKKAFELDYYN